MQSAIESYQRAIENREGRTRRRITASGSRTRAKASLTKRSTRTARRYPKTKISRPRITAWAQRFWKPAELERIDHPAAPRAGLNDDMPWAHHRLGVALYQTGQLDESIAELRRAIEQQPVFPDAQLDLARSLYDYGDLNGVVETCETVIAEHGRRIPRSASSAWARALRDWRSGRGAGRPWARPPRQPDDGRSASRSRSRALRPGRSGRRHQFVPRGDRAAARLPAGASRPRALRSTKAASLKKRSTSLRRATGDGQSSFPSAWHNLGVALYDLGEIDEAITAYRTAIEQRRRALCRSALQSRQRALCARRNRRIRARI